MEIPNLADVMVALVDGSFKKDEVGVGVIFPLHHQIICVEFKAFKANYALKTKMNALLLALKTIVSRVGFIWLSSRNENCLANSVAKCSRSSVTT
ncbi:hypothetical protein F8388_008844 [Cannabis sativa]|uniref:Uncharacterized protein n=1 Tax=Cannabis sativa TaxID=3483 RepID=A0A7J6GXZ7_CANSA|nr:hypothetical protein F8388_008844 [Cannabis sativa]